MNEPRQIYFYCKDCQKYKEEMDMHDINEELCKNCWARNDKRHQNRKGQKTKVSLNGFLLRGETKL